MIYFVQRGNGDIKIGYTRDIHTRLKTLSSYWGKVSLLGLMLGGQPEEQKLHRHFAAYRFSSTPGREWFTPSPEIQSYIEAHATLGLPKKDDYFCLSSETSQYLRMFCQQYHAETNVNISNDEAIIMLIEKHFPNIANHVETAMIRSGRHIGDLLTIVEDGTGGE